MGAEILSQSDIDALLAAISSGDVDLQKDSDEEIERKLREKTGDGPPSSMENR